MDMHLLPAAFALPAGYGDMTVGLLALGMVYLLAKRKPYARAFLIGWNVLGLLDFVVALTTGFTIVGSFAAQVAASGVSPLYLNYVGIVPSFGVPLTRCQIAVFSQRSTINALVRTPYPHAPRAD